MPTDVFQLSRAQQGVRPRCRACGVDSERFHPVLPAVNAGPLQLYGCPVCGKHTFRLRSSTPSWDRQTELEAWLAA